MAKPLLRTFIQFPLLINASVIIASWYMRLTYASMRWTGEVDPEAEDLLLKQRAPAIISFWHGRLAVGGPTWNTVFAGRDAYVLVSAGRDGKLITRALRWARNIKPVFGSKFKGGTEARETLESYYRQGEVIAMTPDGPRGPRYSMATGIARVALAHDAPIVVASISARPAIALGTWDKLLLPLPFSRGHYKFCKPFTVTGLSVEEALEVISKALHAVENECDAAVGNAPGVRPANVPARERDESGSDE